MSLLNIPQADPNDQNYINLIKEHGHAIMNVASPADDEYEIPFSYSTSGFESYGAPEVIVSGLGAGLSKSMINNFMDRWNAGERLDVNRPYEDFLEGFPIIFLEASDATKKQKACFTDWYYEREDFPLWQIVWPGAKHGLFPWEVEDQLADVQECFVADGWPKPV